MDEHEVETDLQTEGGEPLTSETNANANAKSKAKGVATRDGGDDEPLGDAGKLALSRERKRADEAVRRLKELERQEEARERQAQEERDKTLPEIERLRKQAAEADARAKAAERERDARAAELIRQKIAIEIERAATGKFRTPSLAPALVDRDALDYDPETGRIKGVKEELERLLKHAPELAMQGDGRGGTPQPPRSPGRSSEGAGREAPYSYYADLSRDPLYSS